MAPAIGLTVPLLTSFGDLLKGRPPRYKVLACLSLMRTTGMALHQGAVGALAGRLSNGWTIERQPRPGVNVTGAILMALQPAADDQDDPSAVAARALGVQLSYVIGLEDGWAEETQNAHWLTDLNRKHYLAGYMVGVYALAASSLYCTDCGSRRFRDEARCSGCDR